MSRGALSAFVHHPRAVDRSVALRFALSDDVEADAGKVMLTGK
jgi:hypothetical protein